MAKLTMKEIVQTAIIAEELGVSFYKELADKLSQNQELKSVFEKLAKDEAAHKKRFTELLGKVSEKEYHIDEDKEVFLKACDISKFFPKMKKIDVNVKPEEVLKNTYQIISASKTLSAGTNWSR